MSRLERLQREMAARDVGVCVIGPSDDVRYLLGYHAIAVERAGRRDRRHRAGRRAAVRVESSSEQ